MLGLPQITSFAKVSAMLSWKQNPKYWPNCKTDFATQILFACSVTLTKLSILYFYHRIFPVQRFLVICYLIAGVMIAWWLGLVFSIIFSCKPVQFFWDKTIHNGHCVNENSLAYGITAANIVTDIVVLVLPIPWLWRLQMQMSRKLAIIGMFLLGSL